MNTLYVSRASEHFAQVIDTPWIVKQECLDELQEHMGAAASVDFQLSTYQDTNSGDVVRVGRLFHLPFRLSLGLHESVDPTLNTEATLAIFGAYIAAEPLHPKGSKSGLITQKRERARSAIGGALIEASADRMQPDLVQQGLKFARNRRLLDFLDSSFTRESIRFIGRS